MLNLGLNSANVLAQVNVGTNSASILGIFLAVAGAALYFLRNVRPELSRDQDIFFSAVGLLCGFILIFQGWRLDPILQFGQLLLIASTVYFAYESIRLRGIATKIAIDKTPIVDRGREVSDDYNYKPSRRTKAKVEDYEPLPYYDEPEEDEYDDTPRRRISPARESRSSRDTGRDSYYEDDTSRRSNRRGSDNSDITDRPRNKRNTERRETRRTNARLDEDDWGSDSDSDSYTSKPTDDDWGSSKGESRRPRRNNDNPTRSEFSEDDTAPPRPRRRRPPSDSVSRSGRDLDDVMPVEYKPIEEKDEGSGSNNPTNFEDA